MDKRLLSGAESNPPERVPSKIIDLNDEESWENSSEWSEASRDDFREMTPFEKKFSRVFSDIGDYHVGEFAEVNERNDAKTYNNSSTLNRAFPERGLALLVTLAIEIPVMMIITTGASHLSELIGQKKFQLLSGFIPVASAISGNVGLQVSSLTSRAISHDQVDEKNFFRWFRIEICVAFLLACCLGTVVGLIALLWVSLGHCPMDIGFAITVGFSQALSVIVAGITGTSAPLIFHFIFKRDAGKWAGPLETAIQDIAGSFAMVYIAEWLLRFFVHVGLTPPVSSLPAYC